MMLTKAGCTGADVLTELSSKGSISTLDSCINALAGLRTSGSWDWLSVSRGPTAHRAIELVDPNRLTR